MQSPKRRRSQIQSSFVNKRIKRRSWVPSQEVQAALKLLLEEEAVSEHSIPKENKEVQEQEIEEILTDEELITTQELSDDEELTTSQELSDDEEDQSEIEVINIRS